MTNNNDKVKDVSKELNEEELKEVSGGWCYDSDAYYKGYTAENFNYLQIGDRVGGKVSQGRGYYDEGTVKEFRVMGIGQWQCNPGCLRAMVKWNTWTSSTNNGWCEELPWKLTKISS